MHGGDREDPVDRVVERAPRVDLVAARLQPQERRDRLQVVLDAVVDLLGEHAAHHRAPVLERDRRVVGDRGEQRALLVGERRVAVGDELADLRGASSAAASARRARPRAPRATRSSRPRARAPRRSPRPRPSSSSRSPRATPRGRATRRPPRRSARAPPAPRPAAAPASRASRARSTAPPARRSRAAGRSRRRRRTRAARACGRSARPRASRARGSARRGSTRTPPRGRFGNSLNRGSRCACDGIITGARSTAAVPVIPSPGRIFGRRVISSTLVPCVARRTSSSARSS